MYRCSIFLKSSIKSSFYKEVQFLSVCNRLNVGCRYRTDFFQKPPPMKISSWRWDAVICRTAMRLQSYRTSGWSCRCVIRYHMWTVNSNKSKALRKLSFYKWRIERFLRDLNLSWHRRFASWKLILARINIRNIRHIHSPNTFCFCQETNLRFK